MLLHIGKNSDGYCLSTENMTGFSYWGLSS